MHVLEPNCGRRTQAHQGRAARGRRLRRAARAAAARQQRFLIAEATATAVGGPVALRVPRRHANAAAADAAHAAADATADPAAAAADAAADPADAAADAAADDEPQPPQMLKLGSVVVLATSTASGRYDWWAGRVEKMKCTSSKAGRYVNTVTPTQFDQACSDKVKVICSWYRKHANYVFTYDGPVDDKEYNMENALGMLDLEMPDASGRYKLRDPSQGPQLDAALKLTEVPANKKRSRGDEMLAQQARVERESMPAEATKRPRGEPTDRSAAFEGQRAKK